MKKRRKKNRHVKAEAKLHHKIKIGKIEKKQHILPRICSNAFVLFCSVGFVQFKVLEECSA